MERHGGGGASERSHGSGGGGGVRCGGAGNAGGAAGRQGEIRWAQWYPVASVGTGESGAGGLTREVETPACDQEPLRRTLHSRRTLHLLQVSKKNLRVVGGYGAKWAGALVALVGRQAAAAAAAGELPG